MTFSNQTRMEITLRQIEEGEDYWDTLEEYDVLETTWGELQASVPGDKHYFLYRWIMGDMIPLNQDNTGK